MSDPVSFPCPQHDVHSPISRLPTELLLHIFYFLVHTSREWPYLRNHSWLVATYVCRRWREAAIGCTSLWSEIVISAHFPWQLFLRRSGSAPLFISADLPRDWQADMKPTGFSRFSALKMHLPRTHSLDIIAHDLDPVIESLHDVSAPNLQNLGLSEVRIDWSGRRYVVNSPSLMALFSQACLNLQQVTLWNISFPWTYPVSSLRSLSVTLPMISTPSIVDSDIRVCLSRMPLLEHLSLSGLTIEMTTEPPVIHLQRLIVLELKGEEESCAAIWRNLRLSTQASIKLEIHTPSREEITSRSIIPALQFYLSTPGLPEQFQISYEESDFPGQSLRLSPYPANLENQPSHANIPGVTFDVYCSLDFFPRFAAALPKNRFVAFTAAGRCKETLPRGFISALVSAHSLGIIHLYSYAWTNAILPQLNIELDRLPVALPQLHILSLSDVDFSYVGDESARSSRGGIVFEPLGHVLNNTLSLLKRSKRSLPRLEIKSCKSVDGWRVQWEDQGAEVVCDTL